MNNHWLSDRPSYSDTLQASADDLRVAWRLENEVPVIPTTSIPHPHNWIRGLGTLKRTMQMAAEVVVWHPTEFFSQKKNVRRLFDNEQSRIDGAWTVAGEDRNARDQKPPLRRTGLREPSVAN